MPLLNRVFKWLSRRALGAARLTRRVTISREGWYYLFVVVAVFLGAYVRDSNLMLLLSGLLIGPFLFALWIALRGLRQIEVVRTLPGSICAGERLIVDIDCRNRRRRLSSWALVVEDSFHYEGPLTLRRPLPARVLFPFVAPGQACHTTYEGFPPVRGRYVFGPIRISTRYPLGLLRSEKVFDEQTPLIVWPRLGQLTPEAVRLEQSGSAGNDRSERRQSRREADFYGLRDWRSGDSRRWIHWRSTARRGQLVVRQFDEARSPDLALFVDLWAAGNDEAAQDRVETALSFAASMLVDACRRGGRRLSLRLAAAEPAYLQGGASPVLLRELLDVLALARPRPTADLPADFRQALADVRPPLAALFITTRTVDLNALAASESTAGSATSTSLAVRVIDVGQPELARYFAKSAAQAGVS